ncbi:MAG: CBS domain-containing protein [Dermatophilaceae bacterium]
MRIADVLSSKGDYTVVTIRPDQDVLGLLKLLASRSIGAVVVSEDGERIAGIVSERDIVRHLAHVPELLSAPVRDIMTATVHTVTPETTVVDLANEMTDLRIRHVPVVRDGKIVGLVSIGDVVKFRIQMLQDEATHLQEYLHQQ